MERCDQRQPSLTARTSSNHAEFFIRWWKSCARVLCGLLRLQISALGCIEMQMMLLPADAAAAHTGMHMMLVEDGHSAEAFNSVPV